MNSSIRGLQVDKNLYEIARKEVLDNVPIPLYFIRHIDDTIDLAVKPNCLCPFHEEDTPSFRYKSDENYWRCFGKCQDGGTVIELHGRKFGFKNHYEALADLRKRFAKVYGLTARDFFLSPENMPHTLEELLQDKKKVSVSEEDFLKVTAPSVQDISRHIETSLARLQKLNFQEFIPLAIRFDNLYVYNSNDVKEYEEVLQACRSAVRNNMK